MNKIKYFLKIIEIMCVMGTIFLIPFVSPTGLVKLMIGCIVIYLLRKIIVKERIYTYNKLDVYLLIMSVAFLIATIFSKAQVLSAFEYAFYIIIIIFGMITRNVISNDKLVKRVLHLINMSTLLVCLYGFYQAVYIKPMQKAWLDPSVRDEIKFRVISTFENPNLLAIFLVIVIPIALFMMLNERKLIVKAYYALSVIIFIISLGLTFSRTGMLGFVAAIVIFIVLLNIKYILYLIIGGICIIPFLPSVLMSRIRSMSVHDSTVDYRLKIWETTMQMINDNFFTGVGYGSGAYMEEYNNYLGKTKIVAHAHNTVLEVFAESGVIGLIAFVVFIGQIYFNYIKVILHSNKKMQKLILIMGISILTGFMINGIAEHTLFYYKNAAMFYVVFFLTSQYVEIRRWDNE